MVFIKLSGVLKKTEGIVNAVRQEKDTPQSGLEEKIKKIIADAAPGTRFKVHLRNDNLDIISKGPVSQSELFLKKEEILKILNEKLGRHIPKRVNFQRS